MPYRNRVIDEELSTRLRSTGAVVLEGPKACGKTATARQHAISEVLLDVDERARQAIAIDPSLVLDGPAPRLIDEWQIEPKIWNYLRRTIDNRGLPGQFILTGSAVPADDLTRHTGAGRITRLRMRPMTLFETKHSSGAVSFTDLLDNKPIRSADPGLTVADLAELVCVGGWPGSLGLRTTNALRAVRDYLEEIRRIDIIRVDGIHRDPAIVGRLLRSLARNVSTYATNATLARDTGGAESAIDADTVRNYLTALDRLMIVEDQPAWSPSLRSKSTLRQSVKRQFIDPSLAAAALRATPDRLLKDLNLLGFLFESMVVRDLRVYAQAADAQVLQYRDNTGLEVDAIVETADGRWVAFEIKLGPGMVDQAAASLRKFADRVDTKQVGKPAALCVITGFGYGYQRDDGVSVIPVGALCP